jgi:demethylmenaquinone methyltransferase/2-methoxy-6-polyprenyl-1,4-benzoquinol methylase
MLEKSYRIRQMFDRIAGRYDLLNHLLSAGSDFYWRRVALNRLDAAPDTRILDVCVGTGDLARGAMRRTRAPRRVIGVDLALEMMRVGRRKISDHTVIRFVCGNAEALPFRTATFDGVMVAFGVRNFADLTAGLESMRRVLKQQGRLVVLELSRPRLPVIRELYAMYFRYLLPRIGGWISGDTGAYRYLHRSVMNFPEREVFLQMMTRAGFIRTGYRDLSLGVATLYWGEKAA